METVETLEGKESVAYDAYGRILTESEEKMVSFRMIGKAFGVSREMISRDMARIKESLIKEDSGIMLMPTVIARRFLYAKNALPKLKKEAETTFMKDFLWVIEREIMNLERIGYFAEGENRDGK